MPFRIIRDDITKVKADAVVNTANPEPCYGRGTDGAIYQAAGAEALLAERKKIGTIAPGEAAVTAAFDLPAKYIIHTVGPAWIDGEHGEFEILRSCYRKSLLLADQLGCESIAFPLIATGVYGFPKDKALEIALNVIKEHLEDSELNVTLVVFGRNSFKTAESLTARIEEYIDENYVLARMDEEYGSKAERLEELRRRRPNFAALQYDSVQTFPASFMIQKPAKSGREKKEPVPSSSYESKAAYQAPKKKPSLDEVVKNLGESFQQRLLRMIDERGLTDPEVYNRANVDRKLFSKIRCSEDYIPKKKTILALAIGLKLNLDDTKDLLASAGYALTNNSRFDLIVSFCIENGIYNIFEVNALLFQFDQPTMD